jgi:hypothetical protein
MSNVSDFIGLFVLVSLFPALIVFSVWYSGGLS